MDERLLDVIIGVAAFLVLIFLLVFSPIVLVQESVTLQRFWDLFSSSSRAGYLVNGKIT